ncbi:MAG: RtcB family protein [Abitibacteriaceae bacterium]|nr:RtcB family protein [Abditibacteriaceae bacterium]MBV9863860.1 RtcB family protein [Abditibacteriaceae bacterium]
MDDKIITGKIFKQHGWPEGKIIGLAKGAATALAAQGAEREAILEQLDAVRAQPGQFLADPLLGDLARECLRRETVETSRIDDALRDRPLDYKVWGAGGIDPGAVQQMENALRLPVAVAGALMPDAHVGYGLPIGGVLATQDAVIPYAVGVDIACRMRLSLYDVSPHVLGQRKGQFEKSLVEQTQFGTGAKWSGAARHQHEVLDDPAWKATRLLKSLQAKAYEQLGTSGTGNHFVEWGVFELKADAPDLQLAAGTYLALLSHSGSRGVGFKIANEFSRIARDLHPKLENSVRHLAWLPLDSEAGQEYWLSMELAGRFASANHAVIHRRVAEACGVKEIAHVENHHNFAWRETLPDGSTAIVHRKGATPAGAGVLGVIPGSMGDPGYVVRGKGVVEAVNSASHGAGRKMSRRGAMDSITKTMRDRYLQARGVTLLGGGLDESPQAYKDIEEVIAAQSDLVEIIGKFAPRIVRMAEEPGDV